MPRLYILLPGIASITEYAVPVAELLMPEEVQP
jgi:hypothetical protein